MGSTSSRVKLRLCTAWGVAVRWSKNPKVTATERAAVPAAWQSVVEPAISSE